MELTIQMTSHEEAMVLFGLGDRNLKILREAYRVQLTGRGTLLRLMGEKEPVERVASILNGLLALYRSGAKIPHNYVSEEVEREQKLRPEAAGADHPPEEQPTQGEAPASRNVAGDSHASLQGLARSQGQESYIHAILENDIVFCIGPAGTGKTFLAVRMAVSFLRQGGIKRIILCRPAVEAGEKLGFLPGDFQAKINPYLRPLYDALNEILDYDQVKRYLEREIIEIIPLAYMRGRTLNNAFIILDEGQNTSASQMKMFLTRMGMSSKIVVNGDITQLDLPDGMTSGLVQASQVLRGIPGTAWIELRKSDIVRHPLVRKIVEAYEGAEQAAR